MTRRLPRYADLLSVLVEMDVIAEEPTGYTQLERLCGLEPGGIHPDDMIPMDVCLRLACSLDTLFLFLDYGQDVPGRFPSHPLGQLIAHLQEVAAAELLPPDDLDMLMETANRIRGRTWPEDWLEQRLG